MNTAWQVFPSIDLTLLGLLSLAALLLAGGLRIRRDLIARECAIRAAWQGVEQRLQVRSWLASAQVAMSGRETAYERLLLAELRHCVEAADRARTARPEQRAPIERELNRLFNRVLASLARYSNTDEYPQYANVREAASHACAGVRRSVAGFNEQVDQYNSRLCRFPENLIADLVGLRLIERFEVDGSADVLGIRSRASVLPIRDLATAGVEAGWNGAVRELGSR